MITRVTLNSLATTNLVLQNIFNLGLPINIRETILNDSDTTLMSLSVSFLWDQPKESKKTGIEPELKLEKPPA